MRKAQVFFKGIPAAIFTEIIPGQSYRIEYLADYVGEPISLTMPTSQKVYEFSRFPPFFDGLLPEGPQLEGLLRLGKLDRYDYFGQIIRVGHDLVGAVTLEEISA